MYNKSYKGYKKKKYKFRSDFNRNRFNLGKKHKIKNPENTLATLQIIRYTSIILAVVIAFGVITVGLYLYKSGQTLPIENTAEIITTDDRAELLRVVNKNNPLSSDYVPELKEYDSYSVNTLAVNSLEKLLNEANQSGVDLQVEYAYVSYEEQNEKFRKEYDRLIKNENMSEVTAEAKTQEVIPQAGRSEYQTGLLVHFTTSENKAFENTKASKWLENNCVEYGFVLRYTEAKKGKTLMAADANAYRYVGKEDAGMMRSLDMCLNEYLSYISVRE